MELKRGVSPTNITTLLEGKYEHQIEEMKPTLAYQRRVRITTGWDAAKAVVDAYGDADVGKPDGFIYRALYRNSQGDERKESTRIIIWSG